MDHIYHSRLSPEERTKAQEAFGSIKKVMRVDPSGVVHDDVPNTEAVYYATLFAMALSTDMQQVIHIDSPEQALMSVHSKNIEPEKETGV